MSKITLTTLANLQNDTTATTAINSNSSTIQTAMDNTLSRDGTSPNSMSASLDMNSNAILNMTQLDMHSNKIVNLADPTANQDAVTLAYANSNFGGAATYAAAASASATSAATSATNAANSASSAASSVVAIGTSVTQAANSASSAAASATAAATSASSAAASATAAATSASTAANAVGGNIYQYDSNTTIANPSTGFLRLNSATLSAVTHVALNYSAGDSGNPNIKAYLDTWDDSTNTIKGYVIIRKTSAPANFLIASISSLADTTFVDLTVSVTASNGSFTNNDTLSVQFTRAGDVGAAGVGVSGGANHQVALYSAVATISGGVGPGTAGQILIATSSTADPSFSATPSLGVASSTTGSIAFATAGNTGIGTLQYTSSTTSATITLPAATDTLVGKATTDTLTNKTYDTAGTGNVFKINGTTITAVTGSSSVVLATSPTLTTPALGTPSSGTLSNCTGYPFSALTGSIAISQDTGIGVFNHLFFG